MFRNLRLYRVTGDWPVSEEELSNQLMNVPFKPCGAFTERSAGWEAPVAELPDVLARRVAGADLFRLRSQSRLLPAAAVNEALLRRGVIVRPVANYGLPNHLRITVGTGPQNDRLLDSLAQVIETETAA